MLLILALLTAAFIRECFQDQKKCSQTPFHYEYTECDSRGNRLKIQVPNETCIGDVHQPLKAKSCFFSCKAGTYLDAQTEECRPCPPGTYSLGGGYRYEDFSTVPPEFTVTKDEDFETLFGFSGDSEADDRTMYSCKKSGWIASNGYLIYLPGNCVSVLSYSVRLVRPGIVRFTYLYSDKDVVFIFSVKNAQCMAATDEQARQGSVPRMTLDGKWRTYEYNLKTGQTVLSWKGFSYSGGVYQPVLIKNIEITGIAFAQQCSPCMNGSYSKSGQSACSPCQPGTFSEKGMATCKNCDLVKTYSDFQSSRCAIRPPCTSEDYSTVYLLCHDEEKAMISYDWLQPKTCSDTAKSAINLPQPLKSKECSRCNLGQRMTSTGCRFCPKGYHSDGKSTECKQCPKNTQASYAYTYHTWYVMPEHMNASCEAMEDDTIDCSKSSSWILDGYCIKTARTRMKDVYFSLLLHVSGFKNVLNRGRISERNPVGYVSFEFETSCSTTECAFYLAERPVKRKSKEYEIWAQWNGTVPRQTISIPVVETAETTFYWLFVRSQGSRHSKGEWFKDQAKIFSINVTNTIDGGAHECLPCPINDHGQCEACPPGHYLNTNESKCHKCPVNTYLNASREQPIQDLCIPCGLNLKSTDGVNCDSDCTFNISKRYYDLRPLKGNYTVNGVQIFNRDVEYYHVFNFTVCSSNMMPCFSSIDPAYWDDSKSFSSGEALACRFVAVPEKKKVRYLGSAQIGDYLVGVSDNLSFVDMDVSNNDSLKWRYSQLFFLYRDSNGRTKNCPRGRNTILIFRCDPAKNETKVELPASCPDGTCDGCLFQIIITSRFACPVCLEADYVRILGECRMGRQTVHYVPAEHCVFAGQNIMETKVVQCRFLPIEVQIAIGLTLSIALILLISLARVWKKNKRLEYKYMKLIESSGKAGELPAVESCALHEGDEEEDDDENQVDRVVFTKGGKANKWFNKGKLSSSSNQSSSRVVDRTGSENRALTDDNDD